MNRRDFLAGAAAAWPLMAQSTPGSAKLDRVSIMTYNYRATLKLPGQRPSPERTLAVFDIPQMYVDTWGVHNIEFQHNHFESTETSYLADLRSRIAATGSRMTQINLEFDQANISAADPAMRQQAIDLTAKWTDYASVLGCPRVMINQGTLTQMTMANATAALKQMTGYAKTKNIRVSMETRGMPQPLGADGQPGPLGWELVKQLLESSGAYSNVDIGNLRSPDQASLHAAIKGLFPSSSGNMHIKVSPNWDLATAIRFINSELGYKGLYSLEVDPSLIRGVIDTIVANI
jgi:hypothetical protein